MSDHINRSTDSEEREILFRFWEKIPKASFIDVEKQILKSHPARSEILRILKQGLAEGSGESIRYALNAQEIRMLLKKNADISLSATNVYFHLKTLEEHKLIQIVSTILEKRHKVAYYGRSAQHLFIREVEGRLQGYVELSKEFSEFAKAIGFDIDFQKLESLPNDYHDLKRRREEILGRWIIKNEETIEKQNLDLNRIFDFMKLIDTVNLEYIALFDEFQDFLNTLPEH